MTLRDGETPPGNDDSEAFWNWLLVNRRSDADTLLARMSLQALVSDFCHFVFEALSCFRKAKLTVGYALVRKPLCETLFVLEEIALGEAAFAEKMAASPPTVHFQTVRGDLAQHTARIASVLAVLPQGRRYEAELLARLRYDKEALDGFNPLTTRAIHLVTEDRRYPTERHNLNFIFSGNESWSTQWAHVYSRLPYVLSYARDLVELLLSRVVPTRPDYLELVQRRADAGTLLWSAMIEEDFHDPAISRFADDARQHLVESCRRAGRVPHLDEAWLRKLFEENYWPDQRLRIALDRARQKTVSIGKAIIGGVRGHRSIIDDE